MAELIKSQLEQIGIELTINKISDEQYKEYIANKNYQILFTGVYNAYSPDLTYYFAEGNLENYKNDKLFALMQDASIIKDNKQLEEIYQNIYNIYKDEVPFIGLYRDKNFSISSQSLIGTIEANNYSSFYGIENWYRK